MSDWQQQWQASFKSVDALLQYLCLNNTVIPILKKCKTFPIRVPRAFADRIEKGNPNDPLLKQILPLSQELETVAGFSKDPLAENDSNPLSVLLHKYKSRVLLTLSGACAAHFEVSKTMVIQLMRAMIETLPGYLVLKLVYEAPYRSSKIPIDLGMEKNDHNKYE